MERGTAKVKDPRPSTNPRRVGGTQDGRRSCLLGRFTDLSMGEVMAAVAQLWCRRASRRVRRGVGRVEGGVGGVGWSRDVAVEQVAGSQRYREDRDGR